MTSHTSGGLQSFKARSKLSPHHSNSQPSMPVRSSRLQCFFKVPLELHSHICSPPLPHQLPTSSFRQRTTTRYLYRPRPQPLQSTLPMLTREPTDLLTKPFPRPKRHQPLLLQPLTSATQPNIARHTSQMTRPSVLFSDHLIHNMQRPDHSDAIPPNQLLLHADI